MSGATVLVVDDEFIRDLTSSARRIAGFATTMASGGLDALAAIERDHPDIVVLDVGLPGVDGFEVCRRSRAAGDQTPVMFLTARDAAEDTVSGFTRGGDDYLAKPFSIEELVARVRAILRRSRAPATSSRLLYAVLEVDEDTLRVTQGGQPVQLSPDRAQGAALPAAEPRTRPLQGADPRPLVELLRLRRQCRRGRELRLLRHRGRRPGRPGDRRRTQRRPCPSGPRTWSTVISTATCAGTPHGPVALRTIADTIGISADELRGAWRDGQTIAQVAEANGADPQDVIDALTTRATQRITKVVNGDTVRQRC